MKTLLNEFNEILQDKSLLLTNIYFQLQEILENNYGKNSFVLMEIGTFFEVYEVNNSELKVGKAKEIAQLLNIQLTRKNKNILENSIENPIMAGVPSVSLEKHLSKIINEQKYTIAIIKQRGTPPKVSRYLDVVLSPGTNFDFAISHDENNITSLVIDEYKGIYSIGYSAIDVTTGKSYFNEVYGTTEDKSFALDEVFNYMNMHKTNEIIVNLMHKNIDKKYIIEYLELFNNNYHIINSKHKISYQNELFKNTFSIKSLLSSIEHLDMETLPLASHSLSSLIDFIISHDSEIIKKLSLPKKLDISRYMYLGNNALEQLNIIETSHNPSIINLINETSTAMGKRLLKERLSHPIKDEIELQRRYDLSNDLYDYYTPIENELSNIYDIERLLRRIKLSRLHPFELNYLYDSLISIKEIVLFMEKYKFVSAPCTSLDISEFIQNIKTIFDLSLTGKFMLKDIDINILNEGIYTKIDQLVDKNRALESKIDIFRKYVISLFDNSDDSLVTVNRLEKEGFYLFLTKNRYSLIKDKLLQSHILIDDKLYLFKDCSIKIQTNSVKISNNLIDEISHEYVHNLRQIIELNKVIFKEKLMEFDQKYSNMLDQLVYFIAEIDLSVSNIKTSKKYNYICPKIVKTKNSSNFIEIQDLRHPLIENEEEKGLFIPNDIILGDLSLVQKDHQNNMVVKYSNEKSTNNMQGVLLYGINSSGKSSLMKSVGICVILAQAGFFVSASSMRFCIFQSIFTRISGADNIAKGLSSFCVEMLELKNIFNRSCKNSLILGDEISHSTETISGISIVSSAIIKLSKLESIFIFATHLHQLVEIKLIQELKNIIFLHLSVIYKEKEDKLIFNRKLQLGSGSSMYGLEYAKSLHMDKDFLKVANDIRKNILNDYNPIERLVQKKPNRYNKDLVLSSCLICSKEVDDIHHIKEQKVSNDNGFIGHINANHKYNLIPLCKKHHKMVHEGSININGFITTSKGLELHYTLLDDKIEENIIDI